ncbi:hypothetical protein BC938DRAFT_480643, partial [Jimgerdemannia flammicorona]
STHQFSTSPLPSHTTAHDDKIIIQGGDLGRLVGVSGIADIGELDMKASNLSWYVPSTTGTAPSQRVAHSAVMVGTIAFILFGQINNNTVDNNIYALDTNTWTWLQTYYPSHLEYSNTGNIYQNSNTMPELVIPIYIIIIVSGGVALFLIAGIVYFIIRRKSSRAPATADAARASTGTIFHDVPHTPAKYENIPQRYSTVNMTSNTTVSPYI